MPLRAADPPPPGGGAYSSLIAEAAAKYSVSPALLSAMMQNESGGNQYAISPAGAMGLMQLMPGTQRDLGVTDPFDPRQNIMGGAQYLSQMMQMSGGNTSAALARYNWGPGNFANNGGMSNLPPETASYIAKILAMLPGFASGGNFSAGRPIMGRRAWPRDDRS
jgi:soluble lytic murein transglycosylase-like protein